MKLIVVGALGDVGRAICSELGGGMKSSQLGGTAVTSKSIWWTLNPLRGCIEKLVRSMR